MANPEHLAILKQGVEHWNQWRNEHPEIRPDLGDANLSGVNLGDPVIYRQESVDATITSVETDEGPHYFDKFLADPHTSLNHFSYLYSTLSIPSPSGHVSQQTQRINSILGRLRASLNAPDFSNALLEQANFEDAILCGADFSNAYLRRANLCRTDLRKAHLSSTLSILGL